MEKKYKDITQECFFFDKAVSIWIALLICISLALVYWLVYETGGVKHVFSHTSYLPILFAGIFFGVYGGGITGIIAGVLLGPLMPLDTVTGEVQVFSNWALRTFYFSLVGGTIGIISDKLKSNMLKIRYISTHNVDTGFYNMSSLYFDKKIKKFLSRGVSINVLSISWKNADEITNNFGLKTSIAIVKEFNSRLKRKFNKKYVFLHSELSKLYSLIECNTPNICLQEIEKLASEAFIINGIPYHIDFSFGLTQYDYSKSALDPFQKANLAALYAKKTNKKSSVFNENSLKDIKSNLKLLGEFPLAIQSNRILLHYQPVYDLQTKETHSVEALARWDHRKKGLLEPLFFIPLVEESSLIHLFTSFVIEEALKQIIQFNKHHLYPTLSLNLSEKVLFDFVFLNSILELLTQYDVKTEHLELEIPESVIMEDPEKLILVLRKIKSHHIKISIDGFGKGKSSLSYLHRLPIDTIKIDQSLIHQLDLKQGAYATIEAIVRLAHQLNLKVVAKGIENLETEKFLQEMGCDFGQGFLYSKALNAADSLAWLKEYSPKIA